MRSELRKTVLILLSGALKPENGWLWKWVFQKRTSPGHEFCCQLLGAGFMNFRAIPAAKR